MIMGGLTFALRPINLIGTIILARLLSPDDFGAVALVMVLLGTTALFSGLGMGSAVVQSQHDRSKIAFQGFVVTVITSTTLFLLVISNTQFLADLMGDPEIAPIIAWLAFLIPINAWPLVPNALMQKELLYGRIARVNLIGQIAYVVFAPLFAFLGYGVWSLVYAQLLKALLSTVLSWILSPGWEWIKPKKWDQEIFRELFAYGIRATGGGLVSYFSTHWDDWLVGSRLGTAALGFYSKAFEFTNRMVIQLSSSVVGNVFFSSYAKMQEDLARLKRAYLKSVSLVSLIMFPISFGILATGPILVPVLLGDQWLPMIPTLQVFAIMIVTRPVSANTSALYMAIGKPEYNLRAGIVLTAAMVPFVLLLIGYDFTGVAIGVVLADFVGLAFNIWQTNRVLPGSARGSLVAMMPTLFVSLLMFGLVFLVRQPVVGQLGVTIWSLIILVVLGVVVYGAGMLVVQRALVLEILRMVLAVLDKNQRFTRLHAWSASSAQ